MIACAVAVEDDLSAGVIRKIVTVIRPDLTISRTRVLGGFGQIRANILALNNAAKVLPQLVLTDLDAGPCAGGLVGAWMGKRVRHPKLWFRVAVREVEAWLLADRTGIAGFLNVQINLVPHHPDTEVDPKRALIRLASKSPSRILRRALVPVGSAVQGPDYNASMLDFVAAQWDPVEACHSSPSLESALLRLRAL